MASVIIITSCSQENEQLLTKENSVENSMKSSSNISVLYLKLIANHFTNPESFDNLSLETKIDLYEFKYNRFLNENYLTSDQIQAVQGLKVYVKNLEFEEELELSNEKVAAVWSNFDYEQGSFLLFYLGNSPGDYVPPMEIECWWCWEEGGEVVPCHEEFRGGESIGFYRTVSIIRRGAFGIRNRTRDYLALAPCN